MQWSDARSISGDCNFPVNFGSRFIQDRNYDQWKFRQLSIEGERPLKVSDEENNFVGLTRDCKEVVRLTACTFLILIEGTLSN